MSTRAQEHKSTRAQVLAMFLVVMLASSVCTAAGNAEDPDFMFAKKALKDGLYDMAGNQFESILRNYPNTPRIYEAHLFLGRAYYYQNKFTRAL